jgi:hypothetical protein
LQTSTIVDEHSVSISKKHVDGSGVENEIDVLVHDLGRIIECKYLTTGSDLTTYERVKDIVEKFIKPDKLSVAIKADNPNHFGQLNFVEPLNPYYNLNKQEIISGFKNGVNGNQGYIGPGANQITLEKLKTVHEFKIINGSSESPITITKLEWE